MSRFATVILLWLAVESTAPAAERTGRDKMLADAESRLKSIYEKREFAPATFPGEWLADSSGYLMLEPAKQGAEPEVVKYDAKSGKRSILIGADQLVVPGTKERLFVQRFFQTPVATSSTCKRERATGSSTRNRANSTSCPTRYRPACRRTRSLRESIASSSDAVGISPCSRSPVGASRR